MEEFCEFFKNSIPITLFIWIPVIVFMLPPTAQAAYEFPAFRMHQYNLHSVSYGCKASTFSLEAKSLQTWKTARHCVIAMLKDIANYKFLEISQQAGAILAMLPKNVTDLNEEEKFNIFQFEKTMLPLEISIPVYFAKWSQELETIISNTASITNIEDKSTSVLQILRDSVFSMSYQVSASAPKPNIMKYANIPVVQGKLSTYGDQSKIPTIIISSYYDSHALIPGLAFGVDSNASGTSIFLELLRLFSKLYTNRGLRPNYNLVFSLTGSGKFNYIATSKWIDDHLEKKNIVDSSHVKLQNVIFALCLDTLALSDNSTLYLHVSKPPKENTPQWKFSQVLKKVGQSWGVEVKIVHKKINLRDQMAAWQHEIFSRKRLPAFTFSSLQSHKNWKRKSILDVKEYIPTGKHLVRHAAIVAESLARFSYNHADADVLTTYNIHNESLQMWFDYLSEHPRSMQMLCDKNNPIINALYGIMNRYAHVCNMTTFYAQNDGEFAFYDSTVGTISVNSVKPAIFDLILTMAICSYLVLVYLVTKNFLMVYQIVSHTVSKDKKMD